MIHTCFPSLQKSLKKDTEGDWHYEEDALDLELIYFQILVFQLLFVTNVFVCVVLSFHTMELDKPVYYNPMLENQERGPSGLQTKGPPP